MQCVDGLKKGVDGGDGGGEWKKRRRGGGGGGGGRGRGEGHGGVNRGRSEGVLSFGFGSDDCETLTFGLKSCCDGVGYGGATSRKRKRREMKRKQRGGRSRLAWKCGFLLRFALDLRLGPRAMRTRRPCPRLDGCVVGVRGRTR